PRRHPAPRIRRHDPRAGTHDHPQPRGRVRAEDTRPAPPRPPPAQHRTGPLMTTVPLLSRGTGALIGSEIRIFLRYGGSVFFALAFPMVVLIGVGLAIPGMDQTIPTGPAAGLTTIAVMVPPVLAAAMATPALTTVPSTIADYRDQGVLTRLATTPMRPAGVLLAQLIIGVVCFLIASALALVAAALVFDVPMPASPVLTVVA